MAHSVIVGYRSVLAAVVLFCSVPSSVGSATHVPQAAALPRPSNPVNMLFSGLSRCRRKLPVRQRWHIAGVIHRESQRHGYDPLFVLAMVEIESACSPTARSEDGAIGLIQVRPATARAVAAEAGLRWQGVQMLTRPAVNVHLGLRYLVQLERRFHDPRLAMAAYNLGPRRVARMPRHRARAAGYVQKILLRYEELLAQHIGPAASRAS